MPLVPPPLDTRSYQDLLDEALARIPVHTPEWTNFNASDPGVTLIEIFAHMTESLLYRANQIPERNRGKFLQLLGVPLAPAASARGLITISNDNRPRDEVIVNGGLEVLAGDIAFRSERGLDVLPVEARLYAKRLVARPHRRARRALQTALCVAAAGGERRREQTHALRDGGLRRSRVRRA
jgi:predicted phage baseplate assembly protein